MNEEWRKVNGSNGSYEVSNLGNVRNSLTKRILQTFLGKDGYLRTQLGGSIGKTVTIHRLVAKEFCRTCEGKIFVNHKDGNKQNNCADNLEWCTRSENMQHAYEKGLKKPLTGCKNGRSKLNYEDVCFILENYIPGHEDYGATALAVHFGVARQTVSAVVTGQNWRTLHITGKEKDG